jgi:crotonobetainyl-CoA:carnitine CoA-transferase CaiB-like acyl-CoA transferase
MPSAGKASHPTPPLNLLGDYAGGSLFLAMGLLAAILQARASGTGQVVDAAMIDGVGALMTPFFGLHAAGLRRRARHQPAGFGRALL